MSFLPAILKPCAGMHQYGYRETQSHVCMVATLQTYIVGTGHYADGFCCVLLCVCILSPYLGPYLWLAQSDILPSLLSVTGSLIHRHAMLW